MSDDALTSPAGLERDADLRAEFLLDPEFVFLNHGSFGACPRAVFARYQEWQLELERRPVEFLARRLEGLLADARAALGSYLGADPDDLVFVPNATSGANIAAWALDLQPGDEVLSTSLEYGALDLTWEHVCSHASARYVRMPLSLPVSDPDEIVEQIWAGATPRTRALFVSHVTSKTALALPIAQLCERARDAGIVTIVDGAHAPGQVALDLEALGADFYAGNCHKWLCAPKGGGFLYVRRELQEQVPSLVVSWGHGDDATFVSRHEKQGTRDPAAYLTVPDAIAWQREHGWGEVRERCRKLVARARSELGLQPLGSPELCAPQMISLQLPAHAPSDLQERLFDEHRIEIPVFDPGAGGPRLIRASFQGYNTDADLERLRVALGELLEKRVPE